MHPAETNTQVYRPADVVERLAARRNVGTHYTPGVQPAARHCTSEPVTMPVKLRDPAPHTALHAATELISVDRIRAVRKLRAEQQHAETTRIPVAQMPLQMPAVRPAVEVPQPPEPAAEVTVGLLERIRRALRGLR